MNSFPATLARHLFLDRQLAFWRGELGLGAPRLGLVRARVLDVVAETPDVRTFVLRPGAGWRRHQAGQYTTVEVEIDGVRVRRCYSISSAPSDRRLAITVKRVAGGRVSSWLHDNVQAGDVLHLAPPAGDFVLPAASPTPRKLLLLSGGSGITPVMSILRELAAQRAIRDIVFVHHARSRADLAFRKDLAEIAARHLGLRVVIHLDDDPAGPGRFDEAQLAGVVPDFAERATFLCGPAAMMARVEAMWARAGATERLQRERFGAPLPPPSDGDRIVQVRLARAERTVAVGGASTLLEQLERAGERPASGCRMGICQTCKCRKESGAVLNLVTGVVSSEPDEDIQLCISVARSDLKLSL
jgi:stearoyl-CoA 9-desaturase NADPH oxidoreductase